MIIPHDWYIWYMTFNTPTQHKFDRLGCSKTCQHKTLRLDCFGLLNRMIRLSSMNWMLVQFSSYNEKFSQWMSPCLAHLNHMFSAESSAARGNFTPNDLSPRGKSIGTNNHQASNQVYFARPGYEMSWQQKQLEARKKKSSTTLRCILMKLAICRWLECSCPQHNLNQKKCFRCYGEMWANLGPSCLLYFLMHSRQTIVTIFGESTTGASHHILRQNAA